MLLLLLLNLLLLLLLFLLDVMFLHHRLRLGMSIGLRLLLRLFNGSHSGTLNLKEKCFWPPDS